MSTPTAQAPETVPDSETGEFAPLTMVAPAGATCVDGVCSIPR
jgi:hypothetical protein